MLKMNKGISNESPCFIPPGYSTLLRGDLTPRTRPGCCNCFVKFPGFVCEFHRIECYTLLYLYRYIKISFQ